MNTMGLICIVLLVMLFLKVPVYISVMAASALYFLLNPGTSSVIFAQQVLAGSQSLSLLAIPFFVMAGVFMNYTGVTRRIMDMCSVLTARMYGGLAQVNCLLSTLMGGLSGSSLADAAMEAKMLVPAMRAHGYSNAFSSVITAASGMVVPLIPPGTGLIIYACINNISVGQLFVAGIGPGVFLTLTLMIFVRFYSKAYGYYPERKDPIRLEDQRLNGSVHRLHREKRHAGDHAEADEDQDVRDLGLQKMQAAFLRGPPGVNRMREDPDGRPQNDDARDHRSEPDPDHAPVPPAPVSPEPFPSEPVPPGPFSVRLRAAWSSLIFSFILRPTARMIFFIAAFASGIGYPG